MVAIKTEERRFKPGDLVWFWRGVFLEGTACSGVVIETGLGLSTGPSAFSYLVAPCDTSPEWMSENLLWERAEDVVCPIRPQRIYPSKIVQDLFQVQPMPISSSGLLFYLDEVEKRLAETIQSAKDESEGRDEC